MKRLSLSIACFLYCTGILAQTPQDSTLIVKNETIILNVGSIKCKHDFKIQEKTIIPCNAVHGIEGCPNNWVNETKICIICSRQENYKITYKWLKTDNNKGTLEKIAPTNQLAIGLNKS